MMTNPPLSIAEDGLGLEGRTRRQGIERAPLCPRLTNSPHFRRVSCVTARRYPLPLFQPLATHERLGGMPQLTQDRRSIVGGDGCEWLVRELVTRDAGVGRMSSSLVFERPEVVRRVRDYPRNWASLSDDQLYRLSLRT